MNFESKPSEKKIEVPKDLFVNARGYWLLEPGKIEEGFKSVDVWIEDSYPKIENFLNQARSLEEYKQRIRLLEDSLANRDDLANFAPIDGWYENLMNYVYRYLLAKQVEEKFKNE